MASSKPLSDAQAQRLIRLYSEAEAEILQEINRLLVAKPESYSLAWQRTILQRVEQIKADLLKGSRTWCREAIPASYMQGVTWADQDPLAGQKLLAGFGSVHQQAVEVLADNAFNRLENVVHIVGRQVDDIFRQVSLETTKGAVIGYQTTVQAAATIRKELAARGITGFVDKAGHNWNMRRYAAVLAQETTNGAFRQGTINRFQEKGHDLVRVSGHKGACPRCTPFEDRTFSLSGQDPEFPPLDQARKGGLFHVGCLHVLSLAPEEKERHIKSLQAEAKKKERVKPAKKEEPKKKVESLFVFKPAENLADARAFAAEFGVKLTLDKTGQRLDIANHVNEWIVWRKNNDKPIPSWIDIGTKNFTRKGRVNQNTNASYNPVHKRIQINPAAKVWDDPVRHRAETVRSGWHEPGTTLDHEMGHYLHHKEHSVTYRKLSKDYRRPAGDVPRELRNDISRYGGTTILEFVAEMYNGMVHGKTYPEALMKAYKQYKGPTV